MRPKQLQQPPFPPRQPAAADDARFPKSSRLCKRGDFLGVYRRGRRFEGELFVVYLLRTQGVARLGLTVSRKVGKATTRNRIKRLIREHFRRRLKQYEGLDLIVEAKPKAAQALRGLHRQLGAEIDQACRLA